MRNALRGSRLGADYYCHAIRRDIEQQLRKLARQVNAAMRLRITRQPAGVQRNAAPRETLHVWHWRAVINSRSMLFLLLQYGEDSGGRRMPGSSIHRNSPFFS